jgi:hypothetical protein
MLPIIQHNADRLQVLHAKIDETVKNRSKTVDDLKIWQDACNQFQSEYDSLAFPGGLAQGIKKIKTGDIQTIEMALHYLEDTPYCFRSQYVATDLKRAINKVLLPEPLASRFEKWKKTKKIRASFSQRHKHRG